MLFCKSHTVADSSSSQKLMRLLFLFNFNLNLIFNTLFHTVLEYVSKFFLLKNLPVSLLANLFGKPKFFLPREPLSLWPLRHFHILYLLFTVALAGILALFYSNVSSWKSTTTRVRNSFWLSQLYYDDIVVYLP